MDLDQLEAFALSDDRDAVVAQLIPGTEDYYYYRCVCAQQRGALDDVHDLLEAWRERHGSTRELSIIENRQLVLLLERQPDEVCENLRQRLGLHFNHQREVELARGAHPSILDPEVVSWRRLLQTARTRHPNRTDGFTDRGVWRLLDFVDLDHGTRRHMLSRIDRPDHPRLVQHIAADLKINSSHFGSLPVHRLLLPSQLAELAELMPELRHDAAWVDGWLAQFQPRLDEDWQDDLEVRRAYLERLWAAVRELPPVFNSLRAHVLFHLLDSSRRGGSFDRELFLEYLRTPRSVHYLAYRQRRDVEREHLANLGASFAVTRLPPVGDDEELVRELLAQMLVDADDYRGLDELIDKTYLRKLFAATKILAGAGDLERWHSLLDDSAVFAELKDRVDIELVAANKRCFAAGELVEITARVKNVKTLTVNVFEVNVASYFSRQPREVDTTIDLDGLVASETHTHHYDEPPFRRVERRFALESLKKPGTYVVELIGGGKSSRALIHKGGLRFTERVGAAGHVFRVFDEANRRVDDAVLVFAGREIAADERGEITLPFSTSAGQRVALLRSGGRSQVIRFHHRAERYHLRAGFHVEREALIAGNTADVLIRPELTCAGAAVELALLDDIVVIVETTDRRGVSARKEIRDVEVSTGAEIAASFRVPELLSSVAVTLDAKVRSLTGQSDVELSASESFAVNDIDQTDQIGALHLGRDGDLHVVYALGKTGEPRPHMALNVRLAHRDFTDLVDVTLQTDERGRVDLGPLADFSNLWVSAPSGVSGSWWLWRTPCVSPGQIHALAAEPIAVPLFDGEAHSLLEVVGQSFVADRSDRAEQVDGYLMIAGLEPGVYDLRLRDTARSITLRIVAGDRDGGWLLGTTQYLEASRRKLPHIRSVTAGEDAIELRIDGASDRARVHAVASRFVGDRELLSAMAAVSPHQPVSRGVDRPRSYYVSGRDLGDEYRYILERRHADKLPGAAVARPGLLLNPWARQSTDTSTLTAAGGSAYSSAVAAGAPASMAPPPEPRPEPQAAGGFGFANLDFLASPAVVLANLAIGEGGVVRIARDKLAGASQLDVVLADDRAAVRRRVYLDEPADQFRDLRLEDVLDPATHVSQVRQITPLDAGDELVVRDIASATVDVIKTVAEVHGLYCAISGDPTLPELGFVGRWHDLGETRRRELYSKYACHELHLFLYFRDHAFFERVIDRYLAGKHHKTFLDDFFGGAPLERYLESWRYSRLNTLERILLAGRIADQLESTRRRIRDAVELVPRDLAREQRLFDAVSGGGALGGDDGLGFEEAKEIAQVARRAEKKKARGRTRAGGGGPGGPPPAPMAPAAPVPRSAPKLAKMEMAEEAAFESDDFLSDGEYSGRRVDMARRDEQRQLYRTPDKTQEWAENNYYRLYPHQQGPELVGPSRFWLDYAERDTARPFLSKHFAMATSSFAEMMAALAVLDLPFVAGDHAADFEGARMQLRADAAALVFHKEIVSVEPSPERVPVLVSQNYFRADDRYRWEGGEQLDKYVTGELLIQTVYLCQVVLTNPTSSPKKLQLLLQIPEGAIAVAGGYPTRGEPVVLAPYGTRSIEYSFYFPRPGSFEHYPAQVTLDEKLIAAAEPHTLSVVESLSDIDRDSWAHVSQHGSDDEVIEHLGRANLSRIDLDKIAWRMSDPAMFERTLAALERARVFSPVLWSYALEHRDPRRAAEYLRHRDDFLRQLGPVLEAGGFSLEPVERGWYEHLEYAPLVNARAHRLGGRLQIANKTLESQYRAFLERLAHVRELGDREWLEVASYQLLQDRVADAIAAFDRVSDAAGGIQVDYLRAFVALARGDLETAATIAAARAEHPVDRWRKKFEAVSAALDRASGADAVVTDTDDRRQATDQLAATEASFDLTVADGAVSLSYQNLGSCQLSYYLMDIELLFSRQPFLRENTDRFSQILPNRTERLSLPGGRSEFRFDIPAELSGKNVVVEVEAAGYRKAVVHYAHQLSVRLINQYGQLRVGRRDNGQPIPGAYVKVYARKHHGTVDFYKDGYTDLTGGFDYASLSTSDLDQVERFAVLILDAERGSVIREAEPPAR